mgnify:CR=1 FL=1
MSENKITISKNEYEMLKEVQNFFESLEAAGVDNWQGFDFAVEIFRNNYGDFKYL